jgi:nucleoid-associated protein YgaU
MPDTKRVAAEIVNEDTQESVRCYFNPKEYSFAKSNSWKVEQKAGHNVPQVTFGGGQPATLQMELLFDTYTLGRRGGAAVDVRREYTDKLWKLMLVDKALQDPKSKKARPPKVRFQWGKAWSFVAVVTSLQQKFTLFDADGTPVRAAVTIAFQQLQDTAELARQNPTSGGVSADRVWTVTDGDTLASIAHKEYGDPARWRTIAAANNLAAVRRLAPGLVLVIPDA